MIKLVLQCDYCPMSMRLASKTKPGGGNEAQRAGWVHTQETDRWQCPGCQKWNEDDLSDEGV